MLKWIIKEGEKETLKDNYVSWNNKKSFNIRANNKKKRKREKRKDIKNGTNIYNS